MESDVEPKVQITGFTLRDKLFMLTIDDAKGRVAGTAKEMLRYGLAGALLAELALAGRLTAEKKGLQAVDASPLGDAALDAVLQDFVAMKKLRKPERWVSSLAGKKIVRKTAEGLAARNVIRFEEKRYLWVIPGEEYTQQDGSAKYWLKEHLRSVVLADAKADPQDLILLSLLKGCRLLNLLFTRDERKAATKKVTALVQGEVFGKAVTDVLAEIDAAVMAVVIAAAASSS
jgi:hypothetical protein